MTISAFSDELAQVRTKKKEFLSQIERIVPWGEWLAMIQPCYYKGERGNKPYPLEIMLRLYLLQNLYDLSDEATVAEAIDSRAFSEFCGVDSSNQVPDGDTLGRFRNLLIRNGLQEKLFAQVVAALMERGLILKKGTIVDSTIISAPSSTRNKEKKRDPDAHQVKKLRFLIDSLVKLSRLENGIISLSPQPTALQPLLESVVEQYTAKASEKGLSLQMQDTDAFAVFDFKWTAEALANIVDNAIKYTEHGTITISAVSYEMFARIDISDTGSGIPESEQAKIFARFYRSNSVQKQEGVGIGLYLARQIISGEGGYIKVASVPGKGSTFSIFLPK